MKKKDFIESGEFLKYTQYVDIGLYKATFYGESDDAITGLRNPFKIVIRFSELKKSVSAALDNFHLPGNINFWSQVNVIRRHYTDARAKFKFDSQFYSYKTLLKSNHCGCKYFQPASVFCTVAQGLPETCSACLHRTELNENIKTMIKRSFDNE